MIYIEVKRCEEHDSCWRADGDISTRYGRIYGRGFAENPHQAIEQAARSAFQRSVGMEVARWTIERGRYAYYRYEVHK